MGLFDNELENAEGNEQVNLYKENLETTDWLGIIVDNNDPLCLGRCKVKVFEKFDNIPDDALPWAYPQQSTVFSGSNGYGSFSYPKKDTLVRVKFQAGEWMAPEYSIIENINKGMHGEIKESYVNAQVLVYDEEEDLKIIFTQSKGLFVYLKSAFVNITPGGADIIEKSPHHYIDSPDVQVGTGAMHPDTKCDKLFALLAQMAVAIDTKFGVPSATSALVAGAMADVCSMTVKIAP